MNSIASLSYVLAIILLSYHAFADSATVVVDDGRIGIGAITGGEFGADSFSIGRPDSSQQSPQYINEGDGGHIFLQDPHVNGGHRGNSQPPYRGAGENNKSGGNKGGHRGNTQRYPGKPQHAEAYPVQGYPGQRGKGGQGGNGSGQIVIGTAVLPNNKNKKNNGKRRNGNNKQSVSSDALKAIFGSNNGNNGFSNPENEFGSFKDQGGNIHVGAITGGNFGQGLGIGNNKRRPEPNVPNQGNKNVYTGYPNTGNQGVFNVGHGANSNGDASAGDGQVNGQPAGHGYSKQNSEGDDTWIWSS